VYGSVTTRETCLRYALLSEGNLLFVAIRPIGYSAIGCTMPPPTFQMVDATTCISDRKPHG
jgi:hypothetical protein